MAHHPGEDIQHFAVLIGINAYRDSRPLKGCLHDVEALQSFLSGVYPNIHSKLLTADDPVTSGLGPTADDIDSLPTCENVRAAIEHVTAVGRPGDKVLIHFSGHGTRMEHDGEYGNASTGDLALVLVEAAPNNGIRYFRSLELAKLIKEMVDKSLIVTLLLDCCFSGSLVRWDDSEHARFLEYDPEVSARYPLDPSRVLEANATPHACRDGSMLPNWIVNPKGFTILTACEPHEIARELTLEDGTKHGALSYLLLRTLDQLRSRPYGRREIHQQLYARFKQYGSKQTPMLLGNGDLSFLGPEEGEDPLSDVLVYRNQANSLCLQAGRTHGFRDGDQFVIRGTDTRQQSAIVGPEETPVIYYITTAGPLCSELQALETSNSPGRSRETFTVEPISQASLREIPIQLAPDLPELGRLLHESKHHSLGLSTAIEHDIQFMLRLHPSREGEYEISSGSGEQIPGVPVVRNGQEKYVCRVLEHLVKFTHVKSLSTPPHAMGFEKSFDVRIITPTGDSFEPGQQINTKHGDMLRIEVQNRGEELLYLHIYDLGPSWQVENILRTDYEVLPPLDLNQGYTGTLKKRVKMYVPPLIQDQGRKECEDVFKVFVTNLPTSFAVLELPRLTSSTRAPDTDVGKAKANQPTGDVNSDGAREKSAVLSFVVRTTID